MSETDVFADLERALLPIANRHGVPVDDLMKAVVARWENPHLSMREVIAQTLRLPSEEEPQPASKPPSDLESAVFALLNRRLEGE